VLRKSNMREEEEEEEENTSNENSSQRIKSRQRITTSHVVGGRVGHTMHTHTYIAYLPQDSVRILVRQSFRIAAASDLCPSTDYRWTRCKGEKMVVAQPWRDVEDTRESWSLCRCRPRRLPLLPFIRSHKVASFFLYFFFLLSASVSPFVPVSQPPSSSSSHPRLQPILHRNSRSRRNPSTAVKLHLVMYARWGQENENAVPQRRPCEGAFLATLPGTDMLTLVCLLGMSSSFSPSMQLEIFLLSFTRGWISDTSGLLASKCEQEDLLLPSR
jgi:hypothetical protein